jgi:outer membrane lipoprotein-sorting protein
MMEEERMKRTFAICLLGLILFGSISYMGYGQTAKEILDKMIDAQGGRKVLGGIKDTTISGTIEMILMGINGSLTMYQKEPDKIRLDMEFMGMVITQAYDGEKAWMTDPQSGTQLEMPPKMSDDMRRQALGNDSTLNPEKYGITFAAKEKEKIQDKTYLVLEQFFKDGQKITMYIDPATYLIFKTKGKSTDQTGADVEAETYYSDYKKVGDSLVAHAITVHQNGAEAIHMTFTKVVYNTGFQDGFFKMSK